MSDPWWYAVWRTVSRKWQWWCTVIHTPCTCVLTGLWRSNRAVQLYDTFSRWVGHITKTSFIGHWMPSAFYVIHGMQVYTIHGLSRLLHGEMQWLDVPQQVPYKLCTTVYWCLQSKATQYMMDCCIPISNIACLQHLWFSSCLQLFIPCHLRSMFCRLFCVAGRWRGTCCWTPFLVRHILLTVSAVARLKAVLFSID